MLNQPQSGNDMPRFAGIPTMMRLPVAEDARGLDAAFVGIPLDIGTSNRSGTRYGPRQIRQESVMIRPYNMGSGAAPFERLQVADLGDVAINPYSLADSVRRIELAYSDILAHGCIPLTLGGDHTLTLPILRAAAGRHGPVGLIHVDAHSDTNKEMFASNWRTAPLSVALLKRGCWHRNGLCRLGCGAAAMKLPISTGRASRGFAWCRRKSVGIAL